MCERKNDELCLTQEEHLFLALFRLLNESEQDFVLRAMRALSQVLPR